MSENNDETIDPSEVENVEVEETTTEEVVETEAEVVEEAVEAPETTEEAPEPPPEVKPVKREVYTMPVAKAQDEKRKAVEKREAEVRAELEEKYNPPTPAAPEAPSELADVAKKHGLDPDALGDIAQAITAKAPQVDNSKINDFLAKQEITEAKAKVSSEFDEKVAPLIRKDYPQATEQHIAAVKKRIGELAFDASYHTYQLEDIYAVKGSEFKFKNGLGAESGTGRGVEIAKFKILSDEDENKLADTDSVQYAKYVEWSDGQSSRYS